MARLALVTGGCRRLGAHIAARLAAAGYDLALHSGSGAAPEPWLTDAIGERRWHVVRADLADGSDVETLVDRAAGHFGRPVDLLVNSASRFAAGDGGRAGYRDVLDHQAVNLAAPVALAQALAAQAGEGERAVVNILDQRIANPPCDQLAYTLSKQALAEATRTLAIALAPRVRVNGVAPGLVLPTGDYAAGQMERIAACMPLRRLAQARDIADAVAFLADAPAITGQWLYVDGGAHMRAFDRDFVHLARDA